MTREEYEYHKDLVTSLGGLHNEQTDSDYVCFDHYVRPFYRVNFTYNSQTEECQDSRFQALTLKIK